MQENGEFINLIDLGKNATVSSSCLQPLSALSTSLKNINRQSTHTINSEANNQRSNANTIEFDRLPSELQHHPKHAHFFSIPSIEQSALFDESNHINEPSSDELNARHPLHGLQINLNESNGERSITSTNNLINRRNKRANFLSKIKFKKMNINGTVSNSRSNYEKLTNPKLPKKSYGSFARPRKMVETAFNSIITSVDSHFEQMTSSTKSSKQCRTTDEELERFEQKKHLNLLGLKTALIVILTFCFFVSLGYTFRVYSDLTVEKLQTFAKDNSLNNNKDLGYWKTMWIINSILTMAILLVGIVGVLKEKVMLILLTSVYMMLALMESDDPANGKNLFNISLFTILSTSVLLAIFAASLRSYAEEKLVIMNKRREQEPESDFRNEFLT